SLAAGDLDGGGYDEIIFLASDGNPSSVNVVSGSAGIVGLTGDIQTVRSQVISFAVNQGYGALAAGDIDLDGRSDLLIGNPFASPNAVMWAGEAYLFLGHNPLDAALDADADGDLVIQSEEDGDGLGQQLAMGDLDGDDIPDLIVGSPQANVSGRNSAGKVFLFFGTTVQGILGLLPVPLAGPVGLGILIMLLMGAGAYTRMRGA
ncbi:MAG: integrin alpha, partial [Myxococcota bacterium]